MKDLQPNPEIRLKWVGDDGQDYGDPTEFREWLVANTINSPTGKFNARRCRELWAYAQRSDKPPKSIQVWLARSDVMNYPWGRVK